MKPTTKPILQHYVPQFYLRRFVDLSGRLWVWDRERDRVFHAKPRVVAAEARFYYLDDFAKQGHDPYEMERQFSWLEHEVALITGQWLEWIRDGEAGLRIPIPEPNRDLVSLFVALQFLRTADTRDTLARFAATASEELPAERERRGLHTFALWDEGLVGGLQRRIQDATWLFVRNRTGLPFVTSDNPVAFRSGDNRMWLKAAISGEGTYVVYPVAPDVMMYCHPKGGPWLPLAALDSCVSPVDLTEEMVDSENTGQVFMASRFVISSDNEFASARDFAGTIGTDTYAPRPDDEHS